MRPPTPRDPHGRLLVITWRLPNTPAERLERLRLDDATGRRVLDNEDIEEVFLLSTCQRRLVALLPRASSRPGSLARRLADALADGNATMPPPEVFHGWDAVAHLAEVATSLDALTPGETQVVAQFRDAVARARRAASTRGALDRILDGCLRVSRNVRKDSPLGKVRSLVPLVTPHLEQAKVRAHGEGRKAVVSVYGTGEMASTLLQGIDTRDITLHLVSRDSDRAQRLVAGRGDATAWDLDAYRAARIEADAILLVMKTTTPVFDITDIPSGPGETVVLDLGLPRNADPAIAGSVRLIALEDLARVANAVPPDTALLAVRARFADEIARWRRRAAIEADRGRIDSLRAVLDGTSDALITRLEEDLAAGRTESIDVYRSALKRMRHLALEHLAEALSARADTRGNEKRDEVTQGPVADERRTEDLHGVDEVPT
ncbi:MAG: hypothetical protein KY455_04215 [Euryarchaeota archaeon]|nr:hypothetical protein [Euryarchaeota archaeon]